MNQLTTLAKVKEYMGITGTDRDAVITSLIKGVSSFIGSYCGGRKFESDDYVETYDTYDGRHKIFLKQIPVTVVSAVKYRSGTISSPIWVAYSADDYLTYLKEGYLHFNGAFSYAPQGVQVTYTAGYLIDFDNEDNILLHTLPFDLTMAANEMIATVLNTRKVGGVTNETTEGQSITYDLKRGLTDSVKNTLSAYKVRRIAR